MPKLESLIENIEPDVTHKEFRIWLAPPSIQQQIKSHLEQAHHSRQEAQALLAKAKRAVEVAIEEGEAKALPILAK